MVPSERCSRNSNHLTSSTESPGSYLHRAWISSNQQLFSVYLVSPLVKEAVTLYTARVVLASHHLDNLMISIIVVKCGSANNQCGRDPWLFLLQSDQGSAVWTAKHSPTPIFSESDQ